MAYIVSLGWKYYHLFCQFSMMNCMNRYLCPPPSIYMLKSWCLVDLFGDGLFGSCLGQEEERAPHEWDWCLIKETKDHSPSAVWDYTLRRWPSSRRSFIEEADSSPSDLDLGLLVSRSIDINSSCLKSYFSLWYFTIEGSSRLNGYLGCYQKAYGLISTPQKLLYKLGVSNSILYP